MQTRRTTNDEDTIALGVLDANAIETVTSEAWPDPRDLEELHDALVTTSFLTAAEARDWTPLLEELAQAGRATRLRRGSGEPGSCDLWLAAERLPEFDALDLVEMTPVISAPASRSAVSWDRDRALAELFRGRLAVLGPVTPRAIGAPLGLDHEQSLSTLLALESEGIVLRGWFSPGGTEEEWCDRRLLARIHRATLQTLRAEIQPITAADFMRFLCEWQHLAPSTRLSGVDGVRTVIAQLDGFELAGDAWDKHVLRARIKDYDSSMLDLLCYGGEVGWSRLSPPPSPDPSSLLPPRPIRSTPIAMVLREHLHQWRALSSNDRRGEPMITDAGQRVLGALHDRGAQFVHEIAASLLLPLEDVRTALAELVWAGLVASDGFSGLQAIWHEAPLPRTFTSRSPRNFIPLGGRWSKQVDASVTDLDREDAIELYARVLLNRYGIVCRRLLMREPFAVAWRELLRVYRRLEARGEVRGGRFVTGLAGEQFALPDAVELARRVRRTPLSGESIVISAADPLNLCGIVTAGDRVPAIASASVVLCDGIPSTSVQAHQIAAAR